MTVLAPLLLAALAPAARASDAFLRAVDKAESRKDPTERVEYFNRAIEAWQPDDGQELLAHCHLRRGQARFELYQFKEARPDLDKAIELDPGSALAFYLRGRIRARAGRLKEAVVDLAEYTALDDQKVDGWLALGEAQAKLGRGDDALRSFKRAEDLDPSAYRAPLGEARVWMARKQWSRAQERLDAADEAAKHRAPDVFLERAVCAVAAGRYDEALSDYGKALPLFDRRLDDLRRSKAPPAASDELKQEAAHAYFGRGRLNEFLARVEAAAQDYGQACALGHQEACRRLARLRPAQARRPAARTRSRRAKSDPGDRIYAD